MIKIERILVPVDFSESARKALRYGIEIARDRGAKLHILHVINEKIIEALRDLSTKGYKGELLETLRELVQERLEELHAFAPVSMREGIQVDFEIRKGKPAQEVIGFAADHWIDLIILGTVGRSALEAALMGSVARHVAHHAPCPVLLVRPVEHDFIQ
ncbi:MAG: universal stress protein [Syntrophobacteraceae bacterium]|nr:universal stress protein [Syntrophobacteraceae bacterium]